MLPLAQMGLMMVDWLDPHKVVYVTERFHDRSTGTELTHSERDGVTADMGVQLDLAIEVLKTILTESSSEWARLTPSNGALTRSQRIFGKPLFLS